MKIFITNILLFISLSYSGFVIAANEIQNDTITQNVSFPEVAKSESKGLFEQGVDAYRQGDFYQAVSFFKELADKKLQENEESPELYYNLGNAYYKVDNFGYARLYYEKALLLKPDYEEATHNVRLLQQKIEDKIYDNDMFIAQNIYTSVEYWLPSNYWNLIGIVTFVVFLIIVAIFFRTETETKRKIFFYLGLVVLFVCVISNVFAARQAFDIRNRNSAIVINSTIKMFGQPNDRDSEVGLLHLGTKIQIEKEDKDWVKIKTNKGERGWIESDKIAII